MFTNPYNIEDYILVARQDEINREIMQNSLLKQIKSGRRKQPLLSKILGSTGRMLVKFGSYLISRYECCKYPSIRQQDVKIA